MSKKGLSEDEQARNVEMWRIKRLIKGLQNARGFVFSFLLLCVKLSLL